MPAASEIRRILDTGKPIFEKRLFSRAAFRVLARVGLLRTPQAAPNLSNKDTFDLIFLAMLAARDPCSAWLARYAEAHAIGVDLIIRDANLTRARFASVCRSQTQMLDAQNVYENEFFRESTALFAFLTYSSDLARDISRHGDDGRLEVQHLLATYIYQTEKYQSLWAPPTEYALSFPPPDRETPEFVDFAQRLNSWGVDREDLSAAFVTYIQNAGAAEAPGWKDLHSSTFGREPRLPHPSGVFHDPSNRFETMFNVYSVQEDLGHGGAGVVYKVMDEDGGLFALKRLNSGLSNSQKLARFKQEVAYCLRERDERIIRILDYGFRMVDGVKEPFYVMPLLDGPLRKRMKKGLSHHEAWKLFLNMLDAVECAHADNVWHRDLKPENLLYNAKAKLLVLADFGIAHFEEDILRLAVETDNQEVLANFKYAAPEQRGRGRAVDQRADIYALGLMLNELFTDEVPQGTAYKQIGDAAPELGRLDRLVDLMIRQNPEERLATVAAVRVQINAQYPP